MRPIIILLSLFWSTTICATTYVIPLKRSSNLINTFTVNISNVSDEFMLDTGASGIVINANFLSKVRATGKLITSVGTIQMRIANGSVVQGQVVRLKDFRVGNFYLAEIEVIVMPGASAPLLIGQTFFSNFGKMTIDNLKNELILETQTQKPAIIKEIRLIVCDNPSIAKKNQVKKVLPQHVQLGKITEDLNIPPPRAVARIDNNITIRYFDTGTFNTAIQLKQILAQQYSQAAILVENMLPAFNYQPIPAYLEIWFKQ